MCLLCECIYCGRKWVTYLDEDSYTKHLRCKVCNDKNIKIKKTGDTVDYYVGCPKFRDPYPDEDDWSSL